MNNITSLISSMHPANKNSTLKAPINQYACLKHPYETYKAFTMY